MSNQQIRDELQMLTGVIANDITYLVYLLLKDSKQSIANNNKVATVSEENRTIYDIGVDINAVEDWLYGLEEV